MAEDDFMAPESFPVSVLEQRVDLLREIGITHFYDLDNFVIRPKDSVQFIVFTVKMNAWYEAHAEILPVPRIEDVVKGGHYVYFSTKSRSWCRVAVFNRDLDNGEVTLDLLDYGGLYRTSVEQLRFIRKAFCDFPQQATRAKIWFPPGTNIHLPYTVLDHFEEELEDETKSFWAMTVHDKMDDVTGRRIAEIILIEYKDGKLKPYNFGNRFVYGHPMESWQKTPAEAENY